VHLVGLMDSGSAPGKKGESLPLASNAQARFRWLHN
jgi:hypothetical protein